MNGWWRVYGVLFALAISLSALAAANDRLPGDLWLTRRMQDLPGAFDRPFEIIRAVTTTWVIVVVALGTLTAFVFRRDRWAWFVLSVTFLLLWPIQSNIKNVVDRPRPDPALVEHRDTFTSESFPSGHALGSTALFLLFGWLIAGRLPEGRPRVVVWAAVALACLVSGAASVHQGVHWPSDIVGGYLWAGVLMTAAWGIIAWRR